MFAGNVAETGTVFVIDDPSIKDFCHKLDSVWLSGQDPIPYVADQSRFI